MRILLANSAFHRVGGSETYLTTLGENLVRLGHDVRIYTRVAGDMAMLARRRGMEVVDSVDDLGAPADAVLAQDGIVAHDLAAAWPDVPQAFVCHSSLFDVQQPPIVPGITASVIVLNDRVRRRVEALNADLDVVRLTQPIDTQRFSPTSAPNQRPTRALVLSTYLDGAPRRALEEAWGRAGIELVSLGIDEVDLAPEVLMGTVDIVVGKGRAVLEAMSCGRAAYVFDSFGGDGWITPESYAAVEADGITGQLGDQGLDTSRLESDLADYSPELGRLGRELVLRHHDARRHAHDVLDVLTGLGAGHGRPPTLESEVGRQIRLRWSAEAELFGLRAEMRRTNARADNLEVWVAEEVELARKETTHARDELATVLEELEKVRERVDVLTERNQRLRRRLRRLDPEADAGSADD
ncbi:glycosyltransferase [Nocardioides baculatus]|uniref:Glycosyltransferase subfamily 4-like N-terminal domain-containing protein n=1 Tax=Nocardioides baculatus TaxID=2801337 RepID=A0ABS1L5W5_9ACTN|nr:hypothetical protein [Nocardioides baculatus]MBL0747064.1 hypothetical protein [Nocardioides baculatus]